MANLTENRINVVLSSADTITIKNSIDSIVAILPANTTLTDEQRLKYNAIDVSNKVFVEDCLSEAKSTGAEILPSYINLPALQNDVDVFSQLDILESALMNVVRQIKDAKRIAGHEAFAQANQIYNAYRIAAESGIPNSQSSYDKIRSRYQPKSSSVGRNTSESL